MTNSQNQDDSCNCYSLSGLCSFVGPDRRVRRLMELRCPSRPGAALCNPIRLACENARTYGLCPIGVTDVGEVVTATLDHRRDRITFAKSRCGTDIGMPVGEFGLTAKAQPAGFSSVPTRSVACSVEY